MTPQPTRQSPAGALSATTSTETPTVVSFTFRAVLGGVEGDLTIQNGSAKAVADRVRQLVAAGVQLAAPATWRRTPEGLPICERHQAVMRDRSKQGDEWHSHKVLDARGNEVYCRGYPDRKLSPGFFIDDHS
jgi:hypothetical protein